MVDQSAPSSTCSIIISTVHAVVSILVAAGQCTSLKHALAASSVHHQVQCRCRVRTRPVVEWAHRHTTVTHIYVVRRGRTPRTRYIYYTTRREARALARRCARNRTRTHARRCAHGMRRSAACVIYIVLCWVVSLPFREGEWATTPDLLLLLMMLYC